MHISEGVLSGPVLTTGYALAIAGAAYGLKKIDNDRIAHTGILSASFFVASLVHVPLGPSSVHLILNGIVGLLLGWAAFPAILIALVLQGVFFQFGGITTLGVNTVMMALPAVLCHLIFGKMISKDVKTAMAGAFAAGFISVLLAGVLLAVALMTTKESFTEVSAMILAAHLPVMIIEGFIAAFCISFIKKVQPEMLTENV